MPRPLHVTFSDSEGNTLRKGPFEKFFLQGETLRQENGGPLVAVHEDHFWNVDGKRFARFDCDCRVQVRVVRLDGKRMQHYGPYAHFSAQDGITFADHAVFAFADRTIGDWYCHADGLHWAMLIVESID